MKVEWTNTIGYEDGKCVVSLTHGNKGWWAMYPPWVHANIENIKLPPCKTIAGIQRRAEKYITLWVMAGRPEL